MLRKSDTLRLEEAHERPGNSSATNVRITRQNSRNNASHTIEPSLQLDVSDATLQHMMAEARQNTLFTK